MHKAPKVQTTVRITRNDGTTVEDSVTEKTTHVVTEQYDTHANIGQSQYRPVGYCIYCGGQDDLTREHIVPFGLSGTAVLPDASCRHCASITGEFEGRVLRGPMRDVRKLRALQSRSKHAEAPNDAELTLMKDGDTIVMRVPIAEYPIILSFPTFSIPRYLIGLEEIGISIKGIASVRFGPSPEDVIKRFEAQKLTLKAGTYEPVAFARMLAKIAYCFAFSKDSLQKLDGPCLVLPAILGKKDDIGQWVGTIDGPIRKFPELLHRLELHEDREKGLLIAEIQLFADSETPSYGVILGHLIH